ncbi:MAG: DUF1611 domain-containing protein [Saprospiraceae bacterium]|nr:DUF1611 domain-containing protein [Saprospiraceae bacterium]
MAYFGNAIVFTNGFLQTNNAKTAHGLIRGTERFTIVGVVDGENTAGKDAGEMLDGQYRSIPVFEDLTAALAETANVKYLIIGVATAGGILPPDMLETIKYAMQKGLSIVNGLHEYLTDKPEMMAIAAGNNVELLDIRKPKQRKDLHFWTGEIHDVTAPIIAVMGMDCALGKRTTARLIKQACQAEGINAQLVYTGQTGWLQGGEYGFIFDSTLNDFVSGELENAIVSCWKGTVADVILLEGQSSLRNPSGPCGLEFLISGNAKQVVLVHAPKRKYFDDEPHWGEIPSVTSEIDLIQKLGSKVIALALNTEGCTAAEYMAFKAQYEQELNIPVLLPIQEGVDNIIPSIKNLIRT